MHSSSHLVVAVTLFAAVSAPTLDAQNFHIPSNTPASGICNAIPLGGTASGSWSNQKYQCLVTAADLANTPGAITGLGFAPCGTGEKEFGSIIIKMDHFTGGSLSNVFANNLSATAVTVLDARDYIWHIQADVWQEIGLQRFFPYNGIDDVVIEIAVLNTTFVGVTTGENASFHRDTRQRVYTTSWNGTGPTSGSSSNAAIKVEVSMTTARLSTHGRGCVSSNGQIPTLTLSGQSQLGQTVTYDLAGVLGSTPAFLVAGFGNGPPFPLELTSLGFPGCYAYFSGFVTFVRVTDPAGTASISTAVPNFSHLLGLMFYAQWAALDPGTAGITTSNYGRVFVGL